MRVTASIPIRPMVDNHIGVVRKRGVAATMWAMTPIPRPFVSLALFGGLAMLTAGCGGQNPYQAAESANSVDAGTGTNPGGTEGEVNVFTPDAQNVTSCVGTLERPDCGSKSKGGWRMYLTFAVLMSESRARA